jgi:asparagine synthetase B (glutamine-hydrolysing)
MIGSQATPPVRLPEWYARLDLGASSTETPAVDVEDALSVGPLTIFRPAAGCDVVRIETPTPGAVVFDGFLVDHAELSRELGVPQDISDAALAMHAYLRWGTGVFDRLDGCYLLAIWDAARDRVLLGRDAVGRHPAFYARDGRCFWFTSNNLALAESGHVSTAVNRVSVGLLALRYWPEAGETYHQHIQRVRPGHYVEFGRTGRLAEHPYWHPIPPDDEPWMPDAQVLDEFEPALRRAVVRCVRLGPHGIMLSGGLDSVTIAAIATQELNAGANPFVAVCGRTGRALSYEEEMQTRVAAHLGMSPFISTTEQWRDGHDGVRLSLDLCPRLPAPGSIWWTGTYTGFYRRAASRGLHVLLTGSGGDNWLGVADAHAADLLRHGQVLALTRFLRASVVTGGSSIGGALKRRVWRGGMRPLLDSLWARAAPRQKAAFHRRRWETALPLWLCPDRELREALVDRLLGRRTPALTGAGRWPASYYRHGLRTVDSAYMHHEAETGFHVSSMCGLRLLSPYHDRRLVTFFNRISPEMLVSGGRYKGLLRPIVAKYFPGFGLESQRKRLSVPDEQRLKDEIGSSIAAAWRPFRCDTLDRLGLVDAARLARDLTLDGAGFADFAQHFALMSAERWVTARSSS